MEGIEIVDTNADNILEYGACGYKNIKRSGSPEKIEWLKNRFLEGLKIKSLYSDQQFPLSRLPYTLDLTYLTFSRTLGA